MTAAKRSAAMNFGRLRLRLPNQTGKFGRAAASGHYWPETVVVTGSPVAGWLSRAETASFVETAKQVCFHSIDELSAGGSVAEAAGLVYRADISATTWVANPEDWQ
jgi:hypothetical protein